MIDFAYLFIFFHYCFSHICKLLYANQILVNHVWTHQSTNVFSFFFFFLDIIEVITITVTMC